MPFNTAYLLPWLQPRAPRTEDRDAATGARPRVNPEAVAALAIVALPMAWAGLMTAAA